ncbi:MAG TPA: DUF2911 domain-containing protein [Chitinophagaceae bacterium]|nr:DUF2911 domain-containing protein [Chitinophagaceae bacterium]
MKGIITIVFLAFTIQLSAQKLPSLDKSPMDMSYYPVSYPVLKFQNKVTEPLVMRIIYSRPQLNGRKVFGDLQKFGEVWRLGANEVTEIQFFKDVWINNKKIKKGRYSLYCIPYSDKWTLIVNKETDVWGLKYDAAKDVIRTDVPVEKNNTTEALTIIFTKSDKGANMLLYWDDVKTVLPIVFKN